MALSMTSNQCEKRKNILSQENYIIKIRLMGSTKNFVCFKRLLEIDWNCFW